MGQAGAKSAGFYPPWVGPEKGVVWTLLIALVCLLAFTASYVPLAACPANDPGGTCVPEASPPFSFVWGLPLAHLCDCNASTTIRTEPNARAASVASFGATGTTPDDGRSLSVLAVLFAEFFLNDMYYPRANTTYAIDIPQPDPDFAYPTYTTIPADVPYAGTTDGDPLYCPAPVSDTTPFLDLSNVYDGTDAIRLGEGGRFNLTDDTNMLWFDAAGTQTYLMGNDPRDNDSAGLIAMHTLAVRNHNHWADEVARLHPQWTDDQLFWKARQLNVAEWQHIVYHEWLPALLGAVAPTRHSALVEANLVDVNNRVAIEVAEVILPAMIQTMTPPTSYDGVVTSFGTASTVAAGNIDDALRRAVRTTAKKVDDQIVSVIRSTIVAGDARDASAESIQRDRVFRVPDWASIYTCLGTTPIAGDDRDAFQGFLEETVYPGTSMGLTMGSVLSAQFSRLRDSDPLYYEYDSMKLAIGPVLYPAIRRSTLRALLYRNTRLAFVDIGAGNLFFTS